MLTAERLRQILSYNCETGEFTWLVRCGQRKPGYSTAGTLNSMGYYRVGVDNRSYLSHRLAWLWMTGEWPAAEVDHIDGNPKNNAWQNLRAATRAQNNMNVGMNCRNTAGVPGVSFNKASGKWVAYISKKQLGKFDTKLAAYAARLSAERSVFGEFARRHSDAG